MAGMIEIRMIQEMSGLRGDGKPWPPVGGTISVSEAEARNLCRSDRGSTPIAVPVVEDRAETGDAPADQKVETRADPEPEAPKAEEPKAEAPAAPAPAPAPPKAKPGPRGKSSF